jgi:nicotinamide-nucleotide amidase
MPDHPLEPDDLVGLAARVGRNCLERGVQLVTAESCTGGLVGHLLTEVAGSSSYYLGGVVSYSDQLKQRLLDVPAALIAAHGAVSQEVAEAMASGARRAFGADVAASVTGIAGPGGGSDRKPVGLTWVAVADGQGVVAERHVWAGGRSANKRASAEAVLRLLLSRLERQGATAAPKTGS